MKNFDNLCTQLQSEDAYDFALMEMVGTLMATRDRKKMTQAQLSALSGVPQKTISRIENGIDVPKVSTLLKLSIALGLELKLVDRTEEAISLA